MSTNTTMSAKRLGIFAIAIAACIALCCAMPSPAIAADLQSGSAAKTLTVQKSKVHKIKTAKQWHNISKYKGGTFKIMKNIKLTKKSQYLFIKKSKKYTIDLNGHTVKTTYSGKAAKKRSAPLEISKGTVVMKDSSKKGNGVFRGTEGCTVVVEKTGKFYLNSGTVNNDFLDTKNTASSAIIANDSAKVFLNGGSVLGAVHGVSAMKNASVYTTGAGTKTYPYVRGGTGCGLLIASRTAKLSLLGGSVGTKASPDYSLLGTTYPASGWYPVLDIYGKSLAQATGIEFYDAKTAEVPITSAVKVTGIARTWGKRLTTTAQAPDGYYAVYVTK